MAARKVRIFPNTEQKLLFRRCCGTSRFFYNKAVSEINARTRESNWALTMPNLRGRVMTKDKDLTEDIAWQKDIPFDTRQLAVADALKAYKTSMALKKKGHIEKFELGFRARQDPKQSFWIDSRAFKKWRLFPTRLKGKASQIRFSKKDWKWLQEALPNGPEHNTLIQNYNGAWYVVATYKSTIEKAESAPFSEIALDPGARTFQTGYSPQGVLFKSGDARVKVIKALHEKIDHLRSVRDKTPKGSRTKYTLRRRTLKLYRQVHDLVQDLHNQTAAFLVNNFQNILIPTFETGKMVEHTDTRKINNSTARTLQSLSHYKFRCKLKDLCARRGRDLYIIGEEYTSRTCTCCGNLHPNLGGAKVFKCGSCGLEIDRDYQGARNIMLKNWQECS